MMNVTCMGMIKGEVNNMITIQSWYNYCRDICTEYLKRRPHVKIGEHKTNLITYISVAGSHKKNSMTLSL